MLLRRLHFSALNLPLFLALACSDNAPTYPTIVIYGNPDTVASAASDGTGAADDDDAGPGDGVAGAGSVDDHCETPWSGPDPAGTVQCDLNALTDGGELSGNIAADQTLTSGQSYSLKGEVDVLPGVTLTIQPCVKIIGEDSTSALVVLSGAAGSVYQQCTYQSGKPGPGGQLIAVGEPMAPIVFTSSKPKGQRSPADWMGLFLLGNAQNSQAIDGGDGVTGQRVPTQVLFNTECHGWPTDEFNAESSGRLEYVRIEYAARRPIPGTPTSGLTLASIGSGTQLDHIMVSNSADSCFGFSGGAVNADHLIGLNGNGDLFEADSGYSGRLQFLFGRQFPTTPQSDSHGIAVEGAPSPAAAPLTTEQIANFTLCGGGPIDRSPARDGAVLRHSSSGVSLLNGMVTGFAGAGMFVQTDQSNQASVSFVQLFDNTSGLLSKVDSADPSLKGVAQSWFLNQTGNTSEEPDHFCDCWANPPVPVAASAGRGAKPMGFVDESADYMGAFKDPSAASNWMRGSWADWSSQ